MIDKKKLVIERELRKIRKQLTVVTGIKKRRELLKRQRELKKQLGSKHTKK
jgi:translation initiation factor 1 (eIF-1/SUI1)